MFELGRLLTQRGENVSYWIRGRPLVSRNFFSSVRWNFLRVIREAYRYYLFRRPQLRANRIIETVGFDPRRDIVIYPEVVSGNPLGADLVVRWILYFPGVLSRTPRFGPNDLFFHWSRDYMRSFPSISSGNLRLGLILLPYYRTGKQAINRNERPLLLLRKGRKRNITWKIPDALIIDGLNHEKIRELFCTHKRLYSYDAYTAFLTYAVICGCLPIVIPDDDIIEDEWLSNEPDRYGIAYGEENIDFAIQTRGKMLENLDNEEKRISKEIDEFIHKIRDIPKD